MKKRLKDLDNTLHTLGLLIDSLPPNPSPQQGRPMFRLAFQALCHLQVLMCDVALKLEPE